MSSIYIYIYIVILMMDDEEEVGKEEQLLISVYSDIGDTDTIMPGMLLKFYCYDEEKDVTDKREYLVTFTFW